MQHTSLGIIWPVLAVIAVLIVLSSSILLSMITYSRRIRKSEEKFRRLFGRVFDALILFNRDGTVVDFNESAEVLLGYPGGDLRGMKVEDLVKPDRLADLIEGFDNAFLGGAKYLGEIGLVGNDGIEAHAEVGCSGLEINKETFVLASFRNITDRKLMEEQLRKSNLALREALTSVEDEKVKTKRKISGIVEHVLMPSLARLVRDDGTVNRGYFRSLKENLAELASLSGGIGDVMTKLSPREMEICQLTKDGLTAKEIAVSLSISDATVEKHKENIRRKLNIINKKKNLATHLKSLSRVKK